MPALRAEAQRRRARLQRVRVTRRRLLAELRAHECQVALDREARPRIPVRAAFECVADGLVGRDPALAGLKVGGVEPCDRDRVLLAQVGDQLRRSARAWPSSTRRSSRGRLLGAAGVLDPDPVVVRARRVPADILVADALDDRVRVDAVVGGHLRRRILEPKGAVLGRVALLVHLHRVDHDQVDLAPAGLGHVRALDEWVRHGASLSRRSRLSPRLHDSADRSTMQARSRRCGPPRTRGGRMNAIDTHADLVFEGGGVKGIGLAGALAALRSASTGRRTSPGRRPERSRPRCWRPGTRPTSCARSSSRSTIASSRIAAGRTRSRSIERSLSLLLDLGLYEGDRFLAWIGERLSAKGIHTFADLVQEEFADDPRYRSRLQVIASDVTTHELLVLPRDATKLGIEPDDARRRARSPDEHEYPGLLRAGPLREPADRPGARDRRRRHALELPRLALRLRGRRGARVADVRAAPRRAEAADRRSAPGCRSRR